jgi:hypothetical protein
MRIAVSATFVGLGLLTFAAPVRLATPPAPDSHIQLLRTPNSGIQPQTVVDSTGTVHMIYFKGDAKAGDIEYVRRAAGSTDFSQPLRVNSDPQSAVAIGTVRGPQLAVGRNGRAYVIWFGPARKFEDHDDAMPVFFTRLNDSSAGFEPQRNLIHYAWGGDGGLSIAADQNGNVYAVWHATGDSPGEDHRRVYLERSSDDGKSFSRESPVSPPALGACGCCGMRAYVDSRGVLSILFRAAAQSVHRDMTLLTSEDQGKTFQAGTMSSWELNACPMSSASLSEGAGKSFAAWETSGQVYFSPLGAQLYELSPAEPSSVEKVLRKHPSIAANARGEVLLAWTEGTGWAKGGFIAWELFDAAGKPLGAQGHAAGLPPWSLPSAFVDATGNFTIVY